MLPSPLSLELKLGAALALVAALLFGWHRVAGSLRDEGRAQCEAAHFKADQAERERRDAAREEIDRETQRFARLDRDHAVVLAGAAPGLRSAVAAAIGREHPAAGASSPAASASSGVLADVLGSAEQRLRDLAQIADERRTAGLACERAYESLTPPHP